MYGATSVASSDRVCGILDDYGTDIRLTKKTTRGPPDPPGSRPTAARWNAAATRDWFLSDAAFEAYVEGPEQWQRRTAGMA